MNYYAHHLGDYLRETAHLSMLEDAAYRRLIDAYYIKEQPLPAERRAVYRLARANSEAEREAVDSVLDEFFTLADDGWRNNRCENEIEKYRDKQAKAKRSADERWKKERTECERIADAVPTHSEGNAPNNQEPITPSLRSGVARGTRLPPEWMPDVFDDWTQGPELEKFRDYWAAQPGQKGVKADWNATWRNWIRRASEYAKDRGTSRQSPAKPLSAVERVRQANNLDDDGWPMGPDDGDLRPQVDKQLRDEADRCVVEAPFRVVKG